MCVTVVVAASGREDKTKHRPTLTRPLFFRLGVGVPNSHPRLEGECPGIDTRALDRSLVAFREEENMCHLPAPMGKKKHTPHSILAETKHVTLFGRCGKRADVS